MTLKCFHLKPCQYKHAYYKNYCGLIKISFSYLHVHVQPFYYGYRVSHFKTIMMNVCLNVLITGHLLFRTLICHCLFQNKVNLHVCELNFGWPFKRGKDKRKTFIGTTTGKGGCGWLIGVLLTIISEL